MSRSTSASPETPWLSDSHSASPTSSPEAPRKPSSSFKPRDAISRKVDEEESDDEYIGYGKPKKTAKKESLMGTSTVRC